MNEFHVNATNQLGLALSGGGVRAAAFHAGVLKYLAETGNLERIAHISSVSGGSLFTGLVFRLANYRWPTSQAYINDVLPQVRQMLTSSSLQRSAVLRLLLNPMNWRFALSRANVLSQAIENLWGVELSLGKLERIPVWSINCTTGETGRRFRFKSGTMGDYELGYANVDDFSLAKAMAISAAFPGGIGPLTLDTWSFDWKKRPYWGSEKTESYTPPFKKLHLYDGGLYDNLGIEPLFDVGTRNIKKHDSLSPAVNYLIVSDGGASLGREALPHPLNPFRFKRIADIALDQTWALRVRVFVNFLQNNPTCGAYLGIGADAAGSIKRLAKGNEQKAEQLLTDTWLSATEAKRAASYSTTLSRLDVLVFELLERHGYETAKWNMELTSHSTAPDSADVAGVFE